MVEGIGWDSRLQVTADGKGLVKDTGIVLLRKTADATGLTRHVAEAFGPGRAERLDRGVVLVSAATAIAAGARNLSQVERLLAHHAATFGTTGSESTLWRSLDSVDERRLRRLQAARRRARKTAWRHIAARPGGFPWLTIGGKRLEKWVVVDLDATLVDCHSAKGNAAGTYKGGFGMHPLGGWVANTHESLTILPRAGNAGSNTAADHHAVLDEVLDQIPDENKHTKILIRIDGAGASHETIERIIAATTNAGGSRSRSGGPSPRPRKPRSPRYPSRSGRPTCARTDRSPPSRTTTGPRPTTGTSPRSPACRGARAGPTGCG